MILAAGLGTRMRPLSDLRAKPALPVRGRPVISLLLEFLSRQGCESVMINLHHRAESIRQAVGHDHPRDLEIHWSEEATPLGTGGGIRRAANFFIAEESAIVLAGDMLLDLPLKDLFYQHMESDMDATLLLRDDDRSNHFGSIGIAGNRELTRVGKRTIHREKNCALVDDTEVAHGLFTSVRFFRTKILTDWPASGSESSDSKDVVFEDLRDWLIPGIESRGLRVRGELLPKESSTWEPVGTPTEYLRVNLTPPDLPTLGGPVENWSREVGILGSNHSVIVSDRASVGSGAKLNRCVVWDGEKVPSDFVGESGIYAGGAFVPCSENLS
jgi:NDP-sugar pyrophosphorylase family protein